MYSEIYTALVYNLCSYEPQKRLTDTELWEWINSYDKNINDREDFVFNSAPKKIELEIDEMRRLYNEPTSQIQQLNNIPPGNHQLPVEKSIVHPYTQESGNFRPQTFTHQVPSPRGVSQPGQFFERNSQPVQYISPSSLNYQQIPPEQRRVITTSPPPNYLQQLSEGGRIEQTIYVPKPSDNIPR